MYDPDLEKLQLGLVAFSTHIGSSNLALLRSSRRQHVSHMTAKTHFSACPRGNATRLSLRSIAQPVTTVRQYEIHMDHDAASSSSFAFAPALQVDDCVKALLISHQSSQTTSNNTVRHPQRFLYRYGDTLPNERFYASEFA